MSARDYLTLRRFGHTAREVVWFAVDLLRVWQRTITQSTFAYFPFSLHIFFASNITQHQQNQTEGSLGPLLAGHLALSPAARKPRANRRNSILWILLVVLSMLFPAVFLTGINITGTYILGFALPLNLAQGSAFFFLVNLVVSAVICAMLRFLTSEASNKLWDLKHKNRVWWWPHE